MQEHFFVSLQMLNILIKVLRFSCLFKSDFGYLSLPELFAIIAKVFGMNFFLTHGSAVPLRQQPRTISFSEVLLSPPAMTKL